MDRLRDGQYVIAYHNHFVALRVLDEDIEINCSNRSRKWHACLLTSSTSALPVQYDETEKKYTVNQSRLDGVFKICSVSGPKRNDVPEPDNDCHGGSQNKLAFSFVSTASTQNMVLQRSFRFEELCRKYRSRLIRRPDM